MKILTPVEIPKPEKMIDYSSMILTLGSCFADQMGERMKMYGFDCLVNPFGTLYNICSVFNSLMRLGAVSGLLRSQDNPLFSKEDVFLRPDGKFVTWSHHSRCGLRESDGFTAEDFLKKANEELQRAADFFCKADTVIITLGTSYVYKLKGTEFVVSNCHKMPAKDFERVFVPSEDTKEMICQIKAMFPNKRFIFTVSPIRHLSDGAHGNNLSKSALLLAVDGAKAEYFPSYEIMLDELRDYRWYSEDMTHPSDAAIKYIFEKFADSFIAENCKEKMQQELRSWKASQHKIK
ncbi:MAG: GSCFA domain-containing protein [Bacteroidales bacterium]|nr:GSCFA domain-containing protein [Bacteroidales bacterium]MBP5518210.1 GSCFA domain-containing protein [Bacteroidales bacterium]